MTACRFCKSDIPSDATRCPHCTSYLDGEQPQGSPGQITYIIDKGLVTFTKFAAAILAIFLTVGLCFYLLDVHQLSKEIEDTKKEIEKTHVASQILDLEIKKAKADLETGTAIIKRDVDSAEKSANDANETLSRAKQAGQAIEVSRINATSVLAVYQGSSPQVSQPGSSPTQLEHFVDARLLETLKNVLLPEQYSALQTRIAAKPTASLRLQVFDAKNTTDLPGDLVRKVGDAPISDPIANEVYDNLEVVYRFFKDIFGRESVDNHGKTLVASIRYGEKYNNAYWDGRQMVFGEGDGVIFKRFTSALDLIAAQLTHGVVQFTAHLGYEDQTGALNTSMSDVFGSMVKQWALGQTVDKADWLIGTSIIAPGFKGRALVDMANPGTAYDDPRLGKDTQPGHMKDYVHTEEDNGGVHTNSGIPNRAFVLAAKAIGGHSWEKAGKIWYVTLTERLTGDADFAKCATETVSVARDLFPEDPSIAAKVAKAWADVGLSTASGAPSVKR
jgi:cell division protein FtsB